MVSLAVVVLAAEARGALTGSDIQLLETLRTMRQATLGSGIQGRGVALMEETHDMSPMGGERISRGPARVEFAFSGKNNICWQTDIKTATLARSAFTVDDRQTFYSAGVNRGPRVVEIVRRDSDVAMQDEQLHEWSLAEIGKLPWNTTLELPEDKAFAILAARPSTSLVRRTNSEIELSSIIKLGGGAGASNTQSLIVVFDLEHGGMARKCSRIIADLAADGTTVSVEREEATDWTLVDKKIVPKRRVVHTKQMHNGQLQLHGVSTIAFERFQIEPVSSEEFAISRLRIPVGTLVSDHIAGLQYRFGHSSEVSSSNMPGAADTALQSLDAVDAATTTQAGLRDSQAPAERQSRRSTRLLWAFALVAGMLAVILTIVVSKRWRPG